MLPLSGIVAFAGSRHGSPWAAGPVVRAVLLAGGSVRVGCARGVDSVVRDAAPCAVVVAASGFSGPMRVALAARTRVVVSGAQALAVFPPVGGLLGPGSSLAVRVAVAALLPVWVAGVVVPSGFGVVWVACVVAGVPGFLHVLPLQPTLF
jgi:hypothetical protein